MREWHLTHADPMAPTIAADARTGRTSYTDDQSWQLRLGAPDEPALSLETRFGGRVGLARLVPIWFIGRRQVYEAQGYHQPPILTAFAPDYLRVRAALTYALPVTMEFWTMESQVVGGRFTCHNTGDHPQTLRLDLTAQMARNNETVQMYFLTLENNQVALQMGRMKNLQPVLMLDGATETGTRARLSRTLSLEPEQQVTMRWVLAGLPERDASVGLAYRWLAHPGWDAYLAAIEGRAAAAPQIETGYPDWDAALAWSQQLVLRSFLDTTGQLPHPSFVSSRKMFQGYAITGAHAGGFAAPWGGQSLPDALLIAPTVALAAPELAQGMVRNFLAVQRDDGWIDAKPGLGGQRANVLAPPLLATLAYTVYHYTGDKDFLTACLDGLIAFFYRWLKPDMDRDRDGMPEWSHAGQGAFADSPTFAQNRRWAQGIDVTTVEAPDLAAYMVREARSLLRIADVLDRDDIAAEITPYFERLRAGLGEMWDEEAGVFHYRDRDTHACPAGETLFEGKGDQPLRDRVTLPAPGRLVLRVTGGLSRKPKLGCTVEGVNADGQGAHETLDDKAFDWYRNMGSATTNTVWREITYLKFDGLSRVYSIQVKTMNLSLHDQSLLMPLWSGVLEPPQVERTVALLTDPARYWRAYGVPGCPASDPVYDPTQQNGCGALWPRWNVRIAWALLDQGYAREAVDLFRRVLAAQIRSLAQDHNFRALYNPDTGDGMGDSDVIDGVVSMGWFGRLFGAFVLASNQVMITGPFAFEGERMAWTQHGVRVERSADGTVIRFPSGYEATLKPDAGPQMVRDPKAKRARRQPVVEPPGPGAPAPPPESPPDAAPPDPSEGLLPDGT